MALNEVQPRGTTSYLTIAEGKIVIRSKEPREGFVTRTTKTGKEVHERQFESVGGVVQDITSKQTEWGKKWSIDLVDGHESYNLSLNYDSQYAKPIINSLLNTSTYNASEPVDIRPYQFPDKATGKTKTGATVTQGGEKIAWKFGRGEMPDMVQVVVKGAKVWDDTEQLAFLQGEVDAYRTAKLQPADIGF